jgi:Flp pilus assembly protein TadG
MIGRFKKARRGAIGMVFGLILVPLILFVAMAIDYSFFAETRSQIQLAADAAVTHAVRAAAGTYSLEVSQGTASATASTDAITAGNTAGSLWFTAQLGALLPEASVPTTGATSCTAAANPCVNTQQLANAAGFSATVTYQGNYPPFFDSVFHTSATWFITGSSKAQAVYNYVEIMMLIDTSQSMLIGATPTDIATLEQYDTCPPTNRVNATGLAGDNTLYVQSRPDLVDGDSTNPSYVNGRSYQFRSLSYGSSPTSYGSTTAQYDDSFDFSSIPSGHWLPNSGGRDDSTGTCDAANGYQQPSFASNYNPGGAGVPCGFACHNTNTAATGTGGIGSYTADLYGFARYIGYYQTLKLRLDYVMSATEQVITSMINNEQTAKEFSIGVYQFNTSVTNNVVALTAATQGSTGSGDATEEATYNLQGALEGVNSADYEVTPGETILPTLVAGSDGNTNFTTAVTNFIAGKATGGTALAKVTTAANSAANPQKDVFIVTDGLEDECSFTCSGTRVMGEMTSVATEAPAGGVTAATGSCSKFKALGYNVYVLYIDYYPVPHYTYYVTNVTDSSATSPTDSFTNNDYASIDDGSIQQMTTPASMNNVTASVTGTYGVWGQLSFPNDSPTEAALRACASVNPNGSTISPTYFYEATNAVMIGQELNLMLETALGSAIRVTN